MRASHACEAERPREKMIIAGSAEDRQHAEVELTHAPQKASGDGLVGSEQGAGAPVEWRGVVAHF